MSFNHHESAQKYSTYTIGDYGRYLLYLVQLLPEHPMSIKSIGAENPEVARREAAHNYAVAIFAPEAKTQADYRRLDGQTLKDIHKTENEVFDQISKGENGSRKAIYKIDTNDENLVINNFEKLRVINENIELEVQIEMVNKYGIKATPDREPPKHALDDDSNIDLIDLENQ